MIVTGIKCDGPFCTETTTTDDTEYRNWYILIRTTSIVHNKNNDVFSSKSSVLDFCSVQCLNKVSPEETY